MPTPSRSRPEQPAATRRTLGWVSAGLLALLGLAASASGNPVEGPSPEYQVKASYLFNFLHFVDWPEESEELPPDRWVLGVVGTDRFGGLLDAIEAERVRGRPIEVRRFRSIDAAKGCHVLFVGRLPGSAQRRLLERTRSHPILTVGEDDEFLTDGGLIRFVEVDNRIRFEVHPGASDRTDLRLGAQLLKLGMRR